MPGRPPPACPGSESRLSVTDSYWRKFAGPIPVYLIKPSWQMRRQRPREAQSLACGHMARRGQDLSREPGWYTCPTSPGTIWVARFSPGAVVPAGWVPAAGALTIRGPSMGPLPTPWGIFSGRFRSSKFTQSSHLSCRKKSLWPGARVKSGGGGTCELWGAGGAPPSSPSPTPQVWGALRASMWGRGYGGGKTLLLEEVFVPSLHRVLPSACK